MEKFFDFAAELMRVFLPAAADTAKLLFFTGLRLAKKLGKAGLSALKARGKKRGKRALVRKGRRFLRITALVSGSVAVLSCAALILSHKK